MAQERVLISSDWGKVTAELVDNNAIRSLVQMLPLTIEMRDHLSQEKTGICLRPFPGSSGSSISRYPGTLELQSLCDLLPRRPRPSAGHYPARSSDR
jgi:hypothetical protein